jgi:probable HAF family extracellular repeat protein
MRFYGYEANERTYAINQQQVQGSNDWCKQIQVQRKEIKTKSLGKRTQTRKALGMLSVVFTTYVAIGIVLGLPSAAAQSYSVTAMSLQPYGVNASNQITGDIDPSQAGLWQNGSVQGLGFFGGYQSHGQAINGAGQIVGYATYENTARTYPSSYYRGFVWAAGQATVLGTLGGDSSVAYGINDAGQVVGWSDTKNNGTHAFLWTGGKMKDLGTLGGNGSFATGVNKSTQITGWAYEPATDYYHYYAFLWQNGTMVKLGTLGGDWSRGFAVNNAGQIVGQAALPGNNHSHAFLWSGGTMKDLGDWGFGFDSLARAINSTGQIVGFAQVPESSGGYVYSSPRAFLYGNGTMKDLNTLIPSNSGWLLQDATGINDSGVIVGIGIHTDSKGQFFGEFILTPK